jgi:hypothetical protein
MGQSFDDRGKDGEEPSPEQRREFYRQQYRDQGFNDFAADHLSNIPSWEPGSARAFFGRTSEIAVDHPEYSDTSELLRDLAGEVTTRTEVFLLQGLAEGYILNDFSHTALHQRTCKGMKSAVNPKTVFFNETEGLWWPSIGEHFHAVDYIPSLESFTQLTYLFAAAHYHPERVRIQFKELRRDELLFNPDTQRWSESKAPSYEEVRFDRSYTSRDQLMAVLVQSLFSREEAAAELSRYLNSDLFRNEAPVRRISRYSEAGEVSELDQLLLTAAKIFVADPRDRRRVIEERREDSTSGFNKNTGMWYTPPKKEWQRNSSEAAMQRLLSVILNTIASPGEHQ